MLNRIKSLLYEFLASFLFFLNEKKLIWLGRTLGNLMWIFLKKRKNLAVKNIKYHLGLNGKDSVCLAKKSFVNSGIAFLELLLKRKVDFRFLEDRVRILDKDLFKEVVNSSRPIVSVTAHIGAWELLGGLLSLNFRDRPSCIVVRHPKDKAFKEILNRFRCAWNVKVVPNKDSSFEILDCLKKRGIVGFLVDQNCGKRWAIFLKFFRDYAAVNMGPAIMALRAKALVWPVFLLRDRGFYLVKTFEPLDTTSLKGEIREKIRRVALFYTQKVEEVVKEYPDQWFWMHRRWKTRPPWEKKK